MDIVVAYFHHQSTGTHPSNLRAFHISTRGDLQASRSTHILPSEAELTADSYNPSRARKTTQSASGPLSRRVCKG